MRVPTQSKYIAVVCCLMVTMVTTAQDIQMLDIQTALAMARKNNLSLAAKEKQIEIAQSQKKLEQLNLLPSLSLDQRNNVQLGKTIDPTNNEFVDGTIFSTSNQASLNMPLFQGGLQKNKIKAADLDILIQKGSKKVAELNIDLQVVESYMRAFYYQKLQKSAEKMYLLTAKFHEREKAFFAQSVKTEVDTIRTYITMQQAYHDKKNHQANFYEQLIALLYYLNYPTPTNDYSLFQLASPKETLPSCALLLREKQLSSLANQHPNVQQAIQQRERILQKERIEKASLFPSISLTASLGTVYSSNQTTSTLNSLGQLEVTPVPFADQLERQFNQQVGVLISFPISSYFNINQRLKKIALEGEAQELSIRDKRAEVVKEVTHRCVKLSFLRDKWESDKRMEILQYKVVDAINKKYAAGTENWTSLYNAMQEVSKNTLRSAESHYNYMLMRKQLQLITQYMQ